MAGVIVQGKQKPVQAKGNEVALSFAGKWLNEKECSQALEEAGK